MKRRQVVVGSGCVLCGSSAGCFDDYDMEVVAEIDRIELRNDRRDGEYEFTLWIEDGTETLLEETYVLGAADTTGAAVVLPQPVERGTYTVQVTADVHSVTAETNTLVTADQPCIRLQFYLGPETLHQEYQLYDRCD